MTVQVSCTVCGKLIEKGTNRRVTVQKYCSKECRSAFWNKKRSTGVTWGELCNVRYGTTAECELSESDAAWLACAIDGEGTIGVYREHRPKNRSGYRYFAVVQVFNTNKVFVERAAELMGGFVSAKAEARRGNKEVFVATVNRRKVPPVLDAVVQHLVIKKRQAELALRFCALVAGAKKRTESLHPELNSIWLQMKGLNKRGTHSQEPPGS